MRNYQKSIDEKVQDVGDLCVELAQINLIPPSQIPNDYEASSPILSKASNSLRSNSKFTRIPMINIQEETRHRIEAKVSSLTDSLFPFLLAFSIALLAFFLLMQLFSLVFQPHLLVLIALIAFFAYILIYCHQKCHHNHFRVQSFRILNYYHRFGCLPLNPIRAH